MPRPVGKTKAFTERIQNLAKSNSRVTQYQPGSRKARGNGRFSRTSETHSNASESGPDQSSQSSSGPDQESQDSEMLDPGESSHQVEHNEAHCSSQLSPVGFIDRFMTALEISPVKSGTALQVPSLTTPGSYHADSVPFENCTNSFSYPPAAFDRLNVPGDGDCLYWSAKHFIRNHDIQTAHDVRMGVFQFYTHATAPSIGNFLGMSPTQYAYENHIDMQGVWGTENEIRAIATIFQRNVYVFVPKQSGGFDVYRYAPYYWGGPRLWVVKHEPEIPVVLVCTNRASTHSLAGGHFMPVFLRPSAITPATSTPVSPPPQLTRFDRTPPPQQPPQQSNKNERAWLQEKYNMQQRLREMSEENEALKARVEELQNTSERIAIQYEAVKTSSDDLFEVVQEDHFMLQFRKVGSNRSFSCMKYAWPDVAISACSRSSYERRSRQLVHFLRSVTGPPGENGVEEVAGFLRMFLRQQKELLQAIMNAERDDKQLRVFNRKITPSQYLDLKQILNLSWHKVRELRSILADCGVEIFPSELKVREEVKRREVQCPMITGVMTVMKFDAQVGRPVPIRLNYIRTSNLVAFVTEMFERTKACCEMVYDARFSSMIEVNIGGDQGAGWTKLVVSFSNFKDPNSFRNIHLIGMYEGDDTYENLKEFFSVYKDQWRSLKALKLEVPVLKNQQLVVEKWGIRIQIYGDFKYLANILGTSGASSRAPCNKCHVSQEVLKKGLQVGVFNFMQSQAFRKRDWRDWECMGQGEERMKEMGIKHMPIIPLQIIDEVATPGLHITLGLGTDFVNKIEQCAFQRDLGFTPELNPLRELKEKCKNVERLKYEVGEIGRQVNDVKIVQNALLLYQQNPTAISQAEKCGSPLCIVAASNLLRRHNKWLLCSSCKVWYHLECAVLIRKDDKETLGSRSWICRKCVGGAGDWDFIRQVDVVAAELQEQLQNASNELKQEQFDMDFMQSMIKEKSGPAAADFTQALADAGVSRREFHGGILTGDHIMKIIGSQQNIYRITNCLALDTSLATPAEIAERDLFRSCLGHLGKITRLTNAARFLSPEEIQELLKLCEELGSLYETFPTFGRNYTITPKMHYLINHVPDYALRNHTVGLVSEHGIEYLHAHFNSIARRFVCIVSVQPKMKTIVQQHTTQQTPLYRMQRKVWKQKRRRHRLELEDSEDSDSQN